MRGIKLACEIGFGILLAAAAYGWLVAPASLLAIA
jgi:hypothetical protein